VIRLRSQSSWSHDLKPEVALVLKLVIFRYGVLDPAIRASPGAKLQNLKLVSGRHTSPPCKCISNLELAPHA
jgi:hypothetical protein